MEKKRRPDWKYIQRSVKAYVLIIALVGGLAALTAAGSRGQRGLDGLNALQDAEHFTSMETELTRFDTDTEYDENTIVRLELPDDGTAYEITEGGEYLLRGDCRGSIRVDAKDEIVHLFLDGLSIRSDAGPVLYVSSAGKVIVTVLPGTENSFRDSTNYSTFTEVKACVYAPCSMTVNGAGTLYVYGDYRDGIRSKGVFKTVGSTLLIRAKDDGIGGSDGVFLDADRLTVECEGTGVFTRNDQNGKGNVEICGSSVRVIAGQYGIDSAAGIWVHAGQADIEGVLAEFRAPGTVTVEGGETDGD